MKKKCRIRNCGIEAEQVKDVHTAVHARSEWTQLSVEEKISQHQFDNDQATARQHFNFNY